MAVGKAKRRWSTCCLDADAGAFQIRRKIGRRIVREKKRLGSRKLETKFKDG